jgi:hypothetical protein
MNSGSMLLLDSHETRVCVGGPYEGELLQLSPDGTTLSFRVQGWPVGRYRNWIWETIWETAWGAVW